MATIEGKTKILTPAETPGILVVETKEDITAGDGEKRDIISGKARLSTRTTCNVFELLREHGVPLAYEARGGETTFFTRECEMIPVEVVVRGLATGSYRKRNPKVPEGHEFSSPIVEFYLKTNNREFLGQKLPCDDPLMMHNPDTGVWSLFHPKTAAYIGPVLGWRPKQSALIFEQLQQCEEIAQQVFSLLSRAWRELGGTLYDFKLEFGVLPDGTIVVADVIDCDSWRVMRNGLQLSKQGYRDGDSLEEVLKVYEIAAAATDKFSSLKL